MRGGGGAPIWRGVVSASDPPRLRGRGLPAAIEAEARWAGGAPDPLAAPALYDGLLWRRVLGYCVDLAALAVLWAVGWGLFVFAGVLTFGLLLPLVPVALALIPVAYDTLQIGGRPAATLGMRLFDLEVRSWTGRRPRHAQAFLMSVLFYTTIGLTGLLILIVPLFNDRRRTAHDYLSGTVVVRRQAAAAAVAPLPHWG